MEISYFATSVMMETIIRVVHLRVDEVIEAFFIRQLWWREFFTSSTITNARMRDSPPDCDYITVGSLETFNKCRWKSMNAIFFCFEEISHTHLLSCLTPFARLPLRCDFSDGKFNPVFIKQKSVLMKWFNKKGSITFRITLLTIVVYKFVFLLLA